MSLKKTIIGITGSVHSGKTTLTKYLRNIYTDFCIFNSDHEIEKMMKKNGINKQEIKNTVLQAPDFLIEIRNFTDRYIYDLLINDTRPKIFAEIPLLFEGGFQSITSLNICAYCNPDTIQVRSNNEIDNLLLQNQIDIDIKKQMSDIVFNTDIVIEENRQAMHKLQQWMQSHAID